MDVLPVRVYYEDTDAAGVLYHGAVIRYLDRGRVEWMHSRGQSLGTLARERRQVFAVHGLSVRYLRPGRLEDDLMIRTRVSEWGRVSLEFEQSVWRGEECLAEAQVKVACLNMETGRPAAMPAVFREQGEVDA